jgi:hypothetical protein
MGYDVSLRHGTRGPTASPQGKERPKQPMTESAQAQLQVMALVLSSAWVLRPKLGMQTELAHWTVLWSSFHKTELLSPLSFFGQQENDEPPAFHHTDNLRYQKSLLLSVVRRNTGNTAGAVRGTAPHLPTLLTNATPQSWFQSRDFQYCVGSPIHMSHKVRQQEIRMPC